MRASVAALTLCVLRVASLAVPHSRLRVRQAAESPAGPSAVPLPADDPFYRPSPDSYASLKPGAIIQSRAVNTSLSAVVRSGNGSIEAWQVLYRTTGPNGEPLSAITTLFVPAIARREGQLVVCASTALSRPADTVR